MKGVFISSLLLLHFYLDASPEKNQSANPTIKKQKRSPVPTQLTETNYKKILSHDLVIVMITADWCRYCQSAKPFFIENSEDPSLKAYFAFVDLGESFEKISSMLKRLEKEYSLTMNEIPTLLIFKNGKIIEQLIAQQNKEQIQNIVKKYCT